MSSNQEIDLVAVYRRTVLEFTKGRFHHLVANESVKVDEFWFDSLESKSGSPSIVEVVNGDSFTVAEGYARKGNGVAVLNMASDSAPGGGVKRGARAQEESLFRRSNLFQSLGKHDYPLKGTELLFTDTVHVGFNERYEPIDPFKVAVISAPAIRRPALTDQGKYRKEDEDLMRAKIRTILRVAREGGIQILILGAFGCGAYRNPPEQVARIFKNLLGSKEFKGAFDRVVFAVLSRGSKQDQQNLRVFLRVLVEEK